MAEKKVDKKDVGKYALTLGILFALAHLVGILLSQLTQGAWVNAVLALHFLDVSYTLLPLDAGTLITGVVLAFVAGLIAGAVFAAVWNSFKCK